MLLSPAGRRVTGWFERPCHRHTSAATPPAIGDGAIGAGDEFEQACRPLLGLSPRATKYLGFKIKAGQTECRIAQEVDAELARRRDLGTDTRVEPVPSWRDLPRPMGHAGAKPYRRGGRARADRRESRVTMASLVSTTFMNSRITR